MKRKHLPPDSIHTKCPRLDPAIKSKLPKQAKDTDANLVRIQARVLDAVNPLVNLLELACKGTLTPKDAAKSAQQALRLLGNALDTISMDRRQKATLFLNKDLLTLVQEEETFRDAAPLLFAKDFDKRVKEHINTARSLQRFSSGKNQSFQRGRPQCLGEAATARASNRESQPKTERNHAYNILCSKFIKCCEQYRGYCMQRSKGVRDPSRAIYTSGVKLHGTSSSPVPKSPPLQSECRVIQIPMSPLQPMHGPESIHESPETSYRAVEDPRHQTCDLHG